MKKQKIFSKVGLSRVLFTFIISMVLMMNASYMSAQSSKVTVTGVVEDARGDVIGASVLEKGVPSNGVITDLDGNFSLEVNPNATLVVSFVGYKTEEIPLKGKRSVKVVLQEDSELLEEVVVVGYGTMRKKDLTGSVVQINPSKIADQNPASVQDILRGTPGLQIGYDSSAKGSDASILLRGQNSLGTSASLLLCSTEWHLMENFRKSIRMISVRSIF
ncbi:TonB-dependent receptor [Bacteroides reticulotermitis JCM 10512]|uniref:TonB-dependent receptor n=1 Tax=Bacteroides reticulotermitis JCM 10512 TaxID=1445607 RepID=W4V175_9BACE|nr:TonB-dependent receptor [Bacteroides reticulotermitis JCM 10512]